MQSFQREDSQVFTDRQIQMAAQGDQNAISQLYEVTYQQVYRTVKSMVQDEDAVLDIVQDSYVKAFRSLDQLDKPENFRAWMKRIATNKAKDYFKKKRPVLFSEMVSEDDEEIDFQDDRTEHLPEEVIDRQETTRLISEILDSLSEEQRLVIGMFYYEQMSVKEIAQMLGCSENTVKSRLNYGRKKVEAKVLDLEKQGTKLYSLAPLPFLLWLFHMDAMEALLPTAIPPADGILETLGNAPSAASGATSAASNGAPFDAAGSARMVEAAGKAVTKAAAGAGAKAGKALAAKIIAGILAVTVVAGGVTAAVRSGAARGANPTDAGQMLPTEPLETQPDTQPETQPDTQPDTRILEACEQVVRDYHRFVTMGADAFDSDETKYERYPHLDETMYYYTADPDAFGGQWYYSLSDIDGDGIRELLFGFGGEGPIDILDVYAWNGEKMQILGAEGNCQILADGTIVDFVGNGGEIAGVYKMENSMLVENPDTDIQPGWNRVNAADYGGYYQPKWLPLVD